MPTIRTKEDVFEYYCKKYKPSDLYLALMDEFIAQTEDSTDKEFLQVQTKQQLEDLIDDEESLVLNVVAKRMEFTQNLVQNAWTSFKSVIVFVLYELRTNNCIALKQDDDHLQVVVTELTPIHSTAEKRKRRTFLPPNKDSQKQTYLDILSSVISRFKELTLGPPPPDVEIDCNNTLGKIKDGQIFGPSSMKFPTLHRFGVWVYGYNLSRSQYNRIQFRCGFDWVSYEDLQKEMLQKNPKWKPSKLKYIERYMIEKYKAKKHEDS